jgi:hypothetical protein
MVTMMIALLAESNKQDQQLVPKGTKVVRVNLPIFQGHATSHVSVATNVTKATSVVATSGYFGAIRRLVDEINARRVICPKNSRGVSGSCDYVCHQEDATKALPHIYASAKHSHAMNSKRESSNKYANLQSKYVGNLAKIKTFKCHMDARDISYSFVIPALSHTKAIKT